MFSLFRPSKKSLRRKMKVLRDEAARSDPGAGQRLLEHFPQGAWPSIGDVVAAYHPLPGEIDPLPLLAMFACEGATTALPVAEPERTLSFKIWKPGDPVIRGLFGVDTPAEDADKVTPDFLLTPMLAFDAKGRRLGYGAGFYDRALQRLRAEHAVTVIGLAYEAQRVKRVPTEAHDQKMDWILTERAAYETH
ncbi:MULTISPECIES: 5-formyltetrahydrofolate cyclo-ligase [Euryhalocaulis]|uniref:5-formyltetrahydrofolate cyclo-ligase n=1 Tax=Euryhalocaulis TaxID=1712422 RepID=UPI0003AAA10B|nr:MULTISPECIES: 5-formyltetrahydrofolate cyclo-ligase [Euryhalocaulis]MBA4802180.1 5-formyltetrahydrofolate cyclo-ligase [Euryhalocaulis sp.]